MKIGTIICLCALVFNALALSHCKRHETSTSQSDSTPVVKSQQATADSSSVEPLPIRLGNPEHSINLQGSDTTEKMKAIMQNRFGGGAVAAKSAMNSFLAGWNPIGRTVGEVITAFGKPDVETNELLTYRFDSGEGGWDYDFKLTAGKVTGVGLRGID